MLGIQSTTFTVSALGGTIEARVSGSTKELGRFSVPQGSTRGSFTIRGQGLVDLLNQDTNGIVTLIITRSTDESARNGLVHAFATKENTRNAPPILRVRTKPQPNGNK